MKINKISIDFEIIWKKIHASLSEEEEELLKSWLEEDVSHREFFSKVNRFYKEGSGYYQNPVRIMESWNRVARQISSPKKKKRIRRLVFAASIAASITILISIFLLRPGQQKSPASSVLESSIEPGSKQALLILDDGSAYDLSKETTLSLKEGGTLINSTGDALEYIEQSTGTIEMKFNTLSIPRGGEFFLTLSDGTRVWLNSETTLKYPVQFAGNSRIVELVGEAYFEVVWDDRKPFQVISGEQVLEVLGTSFNLSSYSDNAFVYTTLVDGKVNVFLRSNPEILQTLMPSHQSRFEKGTMIISQMYVDVDEFIAWKNGIFSFRNQDLSEMMKTVSRWYNLDVKFEKKEAMNIKFTGEVKRYENFEKILALIEKTNEVKFEINEKLVIVRQSSKPYYRTKQMDHE